MRRRCSTTPARRCKAAKNNDLGIKATYQAGRCYSFIGQHETAIARYKAAQTIDPKHSYADDAHAARGRGVGDLDNGAKVDEVALRAADEVPDGDNVAEAMWRLGWRAWREQRTTTRSRGGRSRSSSCRTTTTTFGEGRQAQYWLGRAYLAKEQMDDGGRAVERRPHARIPPRTTRCSALNRLRENAPKKYEALVAEIVDRSEGLRSEGAGVHVQAARRVGTPGFARAMELLRLGLGEPAEPELKKLGLAPPDDKKRVDDPDQHREAVGDGLPLRQRRALRDVGLADALAHPRLPRAWPIGANRARWQIAYPLAY